MLMNESFYGISVICLQLHFDSRSIIFREKASNWKFIFLAIYHSKSTLIDHTSLGAQTLLYDIFIWTNFQVVKNLTN